MIDKNKRTLILVESPEKARTIRKIFKDAGYNKVIVAATVGHFTKIDAGSGYYNTGIFPDQNFKINYVIDPDKKKIVDELKQQIKFADFVYICTDPDREGEAIAWSCVKFLNIPKSKYKRATYQSINQKAIFDAIDKAGTIDMNLVDSAQARGGLDIMYGFRLSSYVREKIGCRSAGRCQTPAVKLIKDREDEIKNFVPEKYIDLYVTFTKNKTPFKAKYVGTDVAPVKRIKSDEEADKVIKDCGKGYFIVESVEHKDRKENPKPPFSTSTFQQECANKLGLTIKDSAECAQKLFDAGKISYHRTDSEIFEEEFTNELKKWVKANYQKQYVSGTVVKGKNDENAQEGHEALHVLDLDLTPELFAKEAASPLLAKVYRIIYNRTVAAALNPAIIAQTTYNIYNGKHKFVMNSNELKFDGYRCVYSYVDESDEKEEIVKETFKENETLQNCKFEKVAKETTPPSRYKEGSFAKELKEVGIGRPSTYPAIVETVKSESRGYCVVEDKYLKPTEKGNELIEFLLKDFGDLIDIGYTREMEKELDEIKQGKKTKLEVLTNFYNKLEDTIKKIQGNKTCPECGSPMVLRKGRYGSFWGCSNYPKCNHIEKATK